MVRNTAKREARGRRRRGKDKVTSATGGAKAVLRYGLVAGQANRVGLDWPAGVEREYEDKNVCE